jgi:predicted ATPase/class 3 adenylate cyclase
MNERPTGTVTFLFTDIEGSTRLWEEHREAMERALARHDEIMRVALESHDGYVFSTAGDAFSAAFNDPLGATMAALGAQRVLLGEEWEEVGLLRVRMALHTGVAHERAGDYFGPALNRCSRILATGHGGQVLVSFGTEELITSRLEGSMGLRDLGEHQLKDLGHPERLFQLLHPDLPDQFPPLETLDQYRNNLPMQLSSFVGREQELRDVVKRLRDQRLLTLTGVGGSGKTRLGLQAAAESIQDYPDGVWLVELASVTDPERLTLTVAQALGLIKRQGGVGALALAGESRPVIETIIDYLRGRQVLLILDNCEHLITACAELATTLLQSCPAVTIMATSREGLGISGEALWQVPSLGLPSLIGLAEHTYTDAMQLFAERAQAVNPSFQLDGTTTSDVARICRRLDGMPLAIELAAARVRALDVSQISARLDDSFRLLTGGSRTALPRQQTLLATVDWSYDLLTAPERTLFQRLGVFRGGFTLEAAEEIGAGGGVEELDVLDLLVSLVDKSMVLGGAGAGGPGRYHLLETLRQYAVGKLTDTGEADDVRARHADFFLRLAESAQPELRGPSQIEWFDRLEEDHDNLRAAMEWSLESGHEATAVRIAAAIWWFWNVRGHGREGQSWIERLDPHAGDAPDPAAIRLRIGGGYLAAFGGDPDVAEASATPALAQARALGDARLEAEARLALGYAASFRYDYEKARRHFEQSWALYAETRDTWGSGFARAALGWVARMLARLDEAEQHLDAALPDVRASGDRLGMAWMLQTRAILARYAFDYPKAKALHEEALGVHEALGDRRGVAFSYSCLGIVADLEGDPAAGVSYLERARSILDELGEESLLRELLFVMGEMAGKLGEHAGALGCYAEAFERLGKHPDPDQLCLALEGLARVTAHALEPETVAHLLGKADELRRQTGRPIPPPYLEPTDETRRASEEALGDRFGAAFADGATMSYGEAADLALATAQRVFGGEVQ